jgi:hypothetical protein
MSEAVGSQMTPEEANAKAREILPLDAASDDCGFCNFAELRELIAAALLEAAGEWKTMDSAPKGGGAERVDDPAYVESPRILLRFGEEGVSVAYWDWYYAEGGDGCTDGVAWMSCPGAERLSDYFSTAPTHWRHLPAPPEPTPSIAQTTGEKDG